MTRKSTQKTQAESARQSPKRDRIVEVAGRMFMEHGFSAVSMDAIAEAAPVSKPTLYHHFQDKKCLFAAVMTERCRDLFSELESSATGQGDVEMTLKRIGDQYLKLILSKDALSMNRIILCEAEQFPELGKLFYEVGPKRSRTFLADYLRRMDKEKILRVPDPWMSANLLLNMLKSYLHMQCMLGLKKSVSAAERRELLDYAVQVFLDGHGYGR